MSAVLAADGYDSGDDEYGGGEGDRYSEGEGEGDRRAWPDEGYGMDMDSGSEGVGDDGRVRVGEMSPPNPPWCARAGIERTDEACDGPASMAMPEKRFSVLKFRSR